MRAMKILANTERLKVYPAGQDIPEVVKEAEAFHRSIPGFEPTPLASLAGMAGHLNLAQIYVKDESQRLGLKAFKVMGAAYAIGKTLIGQKYQCNFSSLCALPETGSKVFAAATDGNHGKGVAFFAHLLGAQSRIYVPKGTAQDRIDAIASVGGEVLVTEGTYDEAVEKMAEDANNFGWHLISDTAWPGYEKVPRWVMEGYYSIHQETLSQLQGDLPTHVFIQGGVGTLAASVTHFYKSITSEIKVVVVEPEGAACLFESAEIGDGHTHKYSGQLSTIMAGLSCAVPNPLAWDILKMGVDWFISCPDTVAMEGMNHYYYPIREDEQLISGESGAVTLGALYRLLVDNDLKNWKAKMELSEASRVLLINTEGDTDQKSFEKLVLGNKQ